MQKKVSTVLEIGSSKLQIMVAQKGLNNSFNIFQNVAKEYDGYFQGEFVDFENFFDVLKQLVLEIDYKKNGYNKKITVGLPSEFLLVDVLNVVQNLNGFRAIRKKDIDDLFVEAVEKNDYSNMIVVSSSILSIELDSAGKILNNPIGRKARSINAEISIVTAQEMIVNQLNDVFKSLGFEEVEYVCEFLTTSKATIPEDDFEENCLFIDVGHLSTTFGIVKGDGILMFKSIDFGGGILTNALSQELDIPFASAENLKDEIVISLKGERHENYELRLNNSIKQLNLLQTNQIIQEQIEGLGKEINKFVQLYKREFISYLPVYLSGLGISKIQGGKDLLSKCLNRNISLAIVATPGLDKVENSTILGIMKYALEK